jgi:hypothetical protein
MIPIQNRVRSVSVIGLVLLLVLAGFWGCARKKVLSPGFEPLRVIEMWRGQAEAHAKILKAAYQPPTDQYKEAERRYIGAETKANALIDRIVHGLVNNVDLTASQVYEDILDTAFARATAFMAYPKDMSSSSGPKIERPAIKQATGQLWQEYVKASVTRREAIRAELRKLKWKPFEEL